MINNRSSNIIIITICDSFITKFNKTKSGGSKMKFEGTWLVVIILSIEVLAFGEFEQSNQILLIGGISFILSTLFEASTLIRHFIKKQTKV